MSFTGTSNTVTKTPMGNQEVAMELVEKDGFISGVAKGERDRRRN